jgi:hypothetical protein
MMERLLSSEDIKRLAACRAIVADKGASSPYAADCVVRAYQGRHVADLCREAGMSCDEATVITITAGIGTLRMAWTGNHFESATSVAVPPLPAAAAAISTAASPLPLPASPAVQHERTRICNQCRHLVSGRCSVAGCACAGLGQPANHFSRCPIGKW